MARALPLPQSAEDCHERLNRALPVPVKKDEPPFARRIPEVLHGLAERSELVVWEYDRAEHLLDSPHGIAVRSVRVGL
mgnify:CR=1 FL=1